MLIYRILTKFWPKFSTKQDYHTFWDMFFSNFVAAFRMLDFSETDSSQYSGLDFERGSQNLKTCFIHLFCQISWNSFADIYRISCEYLCIEKMTHHTFFFCDSARGSKRMGRSALDSSDSSSNYFRIFTLHVFFMWFFKV